HGFFGGAEGLHGDHGAEDLVGGDVGSGGNVGDDCWLDEVAGSFQCRTTNGHVESRLARFGQGFLDAFKVGPGNHGADFHVVAGFGSANYQRADFAHQMLGELFGHGLVHQHAAGSTAVLAGVPESCIADPSCGGPEIGVGEDNNRRFAAKFQVDALDGLGRSFSDCLTAYDAAGQGNEGDVRVL